MLTAMRATETVMGVLARPRNVFIIIALWCAAHFITRLLLSPVLSLDEAEQMLFAQELSLGYRFRHPPLITWLMHLWQSVFGLSGAALFAFKYVVMFLGFAALYQAGRVILKDEVLAALATFAFSLTYTVGYYPHIDLMHTVLLMSLLSAGLWNAAMLAERGAPRDYLWFGAITAFGILAKYVYAVFPAAVIAALLFTPAMRGRLWSWWSVAALGVCLLLLAPYGYWAVTFEYSLTDLAEGVTKAQATGFAAFLEGTLALMLALGEFTLPFLIIFALLFWHAFNARHFAREELHYGEVRLLDRDWTHFLWVLIVAAALMMWLPVIAGGATAFKARWMHQVLVALPILLFLFVKRSGGVAAFARPAWIYTLAVMAVAVVAIAARFVAYASQENGCKNCWEYQPFAWYAAELEKAGFTQGTIVVDSLGEGMYLGGNLRQRFSESRVLIPGYPVSVFPDVRENSRDCLIAWLVRGEKNPMPSPSLIAWLEQAMGVQLTGGEKMGGIDARIGRSDFTLRYVHIPGGAGQCH
ncbi:MAG TPA: glycosyltransferase family 39 protein [Micropepsaceae bacterium]|nr:glycosyltransferase family 39 protein [Micropepsaceae bacterium]